VLRRVGAARLERLALGQVEALTRGLPLFKAAGNARR
jgi:hypothetical protein